MISNSPIASTPISSMSASVGATELFIFNLAIEKIVTFTLQIAY